LAFSIFILLIILEWFNPQEENTSVWENPLPVLAMALKIFRPQNPAVSLAGMLERTVTWSCRDLVDKRWVIVLARPQHHAH